MVARCGLKGTSGSESYHTYTLFCASHITVFDIAGLVRESNGDANVLGGDEHMLDVGH